MHGQWIWLMNPFGLILSYKFLRLQKKMVPWKPLMTLILKKIILTGRFIRWGVLSLICTPSQIPGVRAQAKEPSHDAYFICCLGCCWIALHMLGSCVGHDPSVGYSRQKLFKAMIIFLTEILCPLTACVCIFWYEPLSLALV
jgi:hypothetical protein